MVQCIKHTWISKKEITFSFFFYRRDYIQLSTLKNKNTNLFYINTRVNYIYVFWLKWIFMLNFFSLYSNNNYFMKRATCKLFYFDDTKSLSLLCFLFNTKRTLLYGATKLVWKRRRTVILRWQPIRVE